MPLAVVCARTGPREIYAGKHTRTEPLMLRIDACVEYENGDTGALVSGIILPIHLSVHEVNAPRHGFRLQPARCQEELDTNTLHYGGLGRLNESLLHAVKPLGELAVIVPLYDVLPLNRILFGDLRQEPP